MNIIRQSLTSPWREYIVTFILCVGLADFYFFSHTNWVLLPTALTGAIVPLLKAWEGIKQRTITIELFNFLAMLVSFLTGEYSSAAFIGVMLTFASYLDWRTESRATNAVEELLKLKPNKAYRDDGEHVTEISSDDVRVGDILVVKNGERIPVDGVIVFGDGLINEASLTGESRPIKKFVGDEVYSSTLSETGVIKIRATKVGSDSTIERMAKLIAEATTQKSKAQRLADRFAGLFLPIVVTVGIATYVFTGDLKMTVAFFLVVCADDIAVSIPLAVTASLGRAAKRGVIIKGGEWLDAFSKVNIIIFDKTGTLTYGDFRLAETHIDPSVNENDFWKYVGIAEKFSEHPVGRAILKEAMIRQKDIADPHDVIVHKGQGIEVMIDGHRVIIGNAAIISRVDTEIPSSVMELFAQTRDRGYTVMFVFIDNQYAGILAIADTPREEARESIRALRNMGIRVIMLTGDNEVVAREVCLKLGIDEFRASVTPEGKLDEMTRLSQVGVLAMVGDGINDAPALARANVGIAMGSGGTAVAVEAANIVILTDELDRIPEMITLARRTVSVVNADMGIWFVTNAIGIGLVFAGLIGPALAAFYNFATDFLPLLNSLRLFKGYRNIK